MLRSVIYSNEITVWWKKETVEKLNYEVYLNDKFLDRTTLTFYKFENLQPDTNYNIKVKFINVLNELEKEYSLTVKTDIKKKIIDVSALCGVNNDGLKTSIIQKALDQLKPDEILYFPTGTYETGALKIHSNTEIYLDEGAILKGSEDVDDYAPKIHSRFEGIERECYSSLLNLGELDRNGKISCENVVIRGKGAIIGGGKALQDCTIKKEKAELIASNDAYIKIKEVECSDTIPGRVRGRLINISNCRNVFISGLTLGYGAAWNVHMIYSENIVTESCRFESSGVWNGDGWNPDSSRDCTIFNCVFCTDDDCIAIKSGKNPEGNIINRPSENICIFSCHSEYGNGITIGSEMSGGIANVFLWDCDFISSSFGFQIKTSKKRGGYIKNVSIMDCKFSRIMIGEVTRYNNDGESANSLPTIEQINISKVRLTGRSIYVDCQSDKYAIQIEDCGIVGKVRNIKIDDIEITREDEDIKDSIFIDIKEKYELNNVKFVHKNS